MRAGEASVTAARVAAYRLTFDRVPAPYGDPAADERLARDIAGSVAADPAGPLRAHLAARTAFVDRAVVRALDRGLPQVVVLGAGYDGRAWRYGKPGVRWFEVDHPSTQQDKQRRLRRLEISTDQVTFVPADFKVDHLAPALAGAGHRQDRLSLFICEGVAVYLDLPVLERLLADVRLVAAPESRLILTLSTAISSKEADPRREGFRQTVATLGEPARSTLTVDEAEPMLHRLGWRLLPTRCSPGETVDRARLAGFVSAEPA